MTRWVSGDNCARRRYGFFVNALCIPLYALYTAERSRGREFCRPFSFFSRLVKWRVRWKSIHALRMPVGSLVLSRLVASFTCTLFLLCVSICFCSVLAWLRIIDKTVLALLSFHVLLTRSSNDGLVDAHNYFLLLFFAKKGMTGLGK